MAEYKNRSIEGDTIVLDGAVLDGCKFENCNMVFKGNELPKTISQCQFIACNWTFEGSAERTLIFMRVLYHSFGRQLIEDTIGNVKKP